MQIAPAELEDLLIGHPDVADACVTAMNRPEEATEVPRAFSKHARSVQTWTKTDRVSSPSEGRPESDGSPGYEDSRLGE